MITATGSDFLPLYPFQRKKDGTYIDSCKFPIRVYYSWLINQLSAKARLEKVQGNKDKHILTVFINKLKVGIYPGRMSDCRYAPNVICDTKLRSVAQILRKICMHCNIFTLLSIVQSQWLREEDSVVECAMASGEFDYSP